MADNKKSFILYTDLMSVVEKLITKDREDGTNNSGELFFHILEYVNDMHPEPKNFLVEMSFEPIRLQLKRDLIKWEGICERNRVNGSKGGRPKKKNFTNPKKPVGYLGTQNNPNEPKKPDNDTDNVNDNVNEINDTLSKDSVNTHSKAEKEKEFDRFNEWIDTEAKYIRKIKDQITYPEYCRIKEKYNGEQIRKVLSNLCNYKKAPTQYTSVNLTFQSWARKEYQNG